MPARRTSRSTTTSIVCVLVAGEPFAGAVAELDHLAVDPGAGEALPGELLEQPFVLALAAAHDRRQHLEPRALGQLSTRSTICCGVWRVITRPQFGQCGTPMRGVEQAQVVVDLGDRADRRARVARRRLLVDRDRRRQALDEVDVGLVHLAEELPRVRRQRLDVAALALGVDRVERERRLARAREPGEDDQPVARQVEVDVPEVVLAGAPDPDRVDDRVRHRTNSTRADTRSNECSVREELAPDPVSASSCRRHQAQNSSAPSARSGAHRGSPGSRHGSRRGSGARFGARSDADRREHRTRSEFRGTGTDREPGGPCTPTSQSISSRYQTGTMATTSPGRARTRTWSAETPLPQVPSWNATVLGTTTTTSAITADARRSSECASRGVGQPRDGEDRSPRGHRQRAVHEEVREHAEQPRRPPMDRAQRHPDTREDSVAPPHHHESADDRRDDEHRDPIREADAVGDRGEEPPQRRRRYPVDRVRGPLVEECRPPQRDPREDAPSNPAPPTPPPPGRCAALRSLRALPPGGKPTRGRAARR